MNPNNPNYYDSLLRNRNGGIPGGSPGFRPTIANSLTSGLAESLLVHPSNSIGNPAALYAAGATNATGSLSNHQQQQQQQQQQRLELELLALQQRADRTAELERLLQHELNSSTLHSNDNKVASFMGVPHSNTSVRSKLLQELQQQQQQQQQFRALQDTTTRSSSMADSLLLERYMALASSSGLNQRQAPQVQLPSSDEYQRLMWLRQQQQQQQQAFASPPSSSLSLRQQLNLDQQGPNLAVLQSPVLPRPNQKRPLSPSSRNILNCKYKKSKRGSAKHGSPTTSPTSSSPISRANQILAQLAQDKSVCTRNRKAKFSLPKTTTSKPFKLDLSSYQTLWNKVEKSKYPRELFSRMVHRCPQKLVGRKSIAKDYENAAAKL